MNQPGPLMLGLSIGITILLAVIAWLGYTGKLRLLSRRAEDWSGSLPVFESTELSPQEHAKWKSVPRFEADPLSGLLTGKQAADSGKAAEAELGEGNEHWRWQVPGSPFNLDRDQPSAGSSVQSLRDQAFRVRLTPGQEILMGKKGLLCPVVPTDGGAVVLWWWGATVLLSPETAVRPPGQHSARDYLELTEPNAAVPKRIELHQPHFIIGRSPDVAQFVAEGVGTSRAHVELSRESGGYVLKDLGSRNGTMLKGSLWCRIKNIL